MDFIGKTPVIQNGYILKLNIPHGCEVYYSKNKDKRSCLYQSNKLRQLAALHERSAFYEKLLNGENIMKLMQMSSIKVLLILHHAH